MRNKPGFVNLNVIGTTNGSFGAPLANACSPRQVHGTRRTGKSFPVRANRFATIPLKLGRLRYWCCPRVREVRFCTPRTWNSTEIRKLVNYKHESKNKSSTPDQHD